jgi:short subunit dehydrogenase-like uncharacterized protein
MADIVLFGATGFTGRLTANALARRNADFAIAGRNPTKLERLAQATGNPDIRIAHAGDDSSLVRALKDARVLITCVGPFVELGITAARAAIEAGVHYIDSCGEAVFINRLIEEFDAPARAANIAMAPALGFDEVPADVGVTLACEDMNLPSVVVTFATPTTPSSGTLRSALQMLTGGGWRIVNGELAQLHTADRERWAPMPPPLGVRRSISAPMAIGRLAPLHIEFESLDVFVTTGTVQRPALKAGLPVLRSGLATPPVRELLWRIVDRWPEGPRGKSRRAWWTVLVEAQSGNHFRNVVVTGRDVYGLTAELLATGALVMSDEKYSWSGVLSPVDATGFETLHKELVDNGVTIESFQAV